MVVVLLLFVCFVVLGLLFFVLFLGEEGFGVLGVGWGCCCLFCLSVVVVVLFLTEHIVIDLFPNKSKSALI